MTKMSTRRKKLLEDILEDSENLVSLAKELGNTADKVRKLAEILEKADSELGSTAQEMEQLTRGIAGEESENWDGEQEAALTDREVQEIRKLGDDLKKERTIASRIEQVKEEMDEQMEAIDNWTERMLVDPIEDITEKVDEL